MQRVRRNLVVGVKSLLGSSVVMAVIAQSLIQFYTNTAFATGLVVTPVTHSLANGATVISSFDARGYKNVSVAFTYNAEQLDSGDVVTFGWQIVGGAEQNLGRMDGKNEVGQSAATDETGSFANITLPDSANNQQLQLYFTNSSNSQSDTVQISNILITADTDTYNDTVPPSAPAASLAGGTYGSSQVVTLTSKDNMESSPEIFFTTDNSTPSSVSTKYIEPIVLHSSQTLKAIAYDTAGNASEVSSVSYTILKAPTNLAPDDNVVSSNRDLSMSWDVVVGALGYEYRASHSRNDDGSLGDIIAADTSINAPDRYSIYNGRVTRFNSQLYDGEYYWQVRALGENATYSDWTSVSKIIIDTTPPIVTFAYSPTNDAPNKGPVTITVSANEPIQTISPDQNWKKVSDNVYTKSVQANEVGALTITDLAGNSSEPQVYAVTSIDTISPIVTINQIMRSGDGRYIVYGSVDDPDAEVAIRLEDAEPQLATKIGKNWSFTTGVLADGVYTLEVTAQDMVGNRSAVVNRSFNVVTPFTSGSTVVVAVSPLETLTLAPSVFQPPRLMQDDMTPKVLTTNLSQETKDDTTKMNISNKDKQSDVMVAVAPSGQGWRFWGVTWYWFIIPLIVGGIIGRYILRRRFHRN